STKPPTSAKPPELKSNPRTMKLAPVCSTIRPRTDYDALNRLSAITDPLSFATTYAYDPVGNVTAVTDANGKTNQFTYDELNRLIEISYADGKSVTYAYDPNGNRTTMADSHGTTSYSYDPLDMLGSITHPGRKLVAHGETAA